MTKTTMLTYGVFSLLSCTALAGSVFASDPDQGFGPAPHIRILQKADQNGDGQITREEIVKTRSEKFDQLDRNGDGYISATEKRFAKFKRKGKHRERRAARRFDRSAAIDTNNDGNVSWDEFVASPSPIFERLDTNGDGVISKSEHEDFRKQKFARLDANDDGLLNKDDRKFAKNQKRSKVKKRYVERDTNADGRISRSEFMSGKSRMMMRFDSNDDGVITQLELEAATINSLGRGRFWQQDD